MCCHSAPYLLSTCGRRVALETRWKERGTLGAGLRAASHAHEACRAGWLAGSRRHKHPPLAGTAAARATPQRTPGTVRPRRRSGAPSQRRSARGATPARRPRPQAAPPDQQASSAASWQQTGHPPLPCSSGQTAGRPGRCRPLRCWTWARPQAAAAPAGARAAAVAAIRWGQFSN